MISYMSLRVHEIIVELPVIQPFSFDQNGLNGGTSSKIFCMVTAGDLPVQIQWYKDNELLKQNDKKKILLLDDTTSVLSLMKLDLDDAAEYICEARNIAGITNHSTVLRVKGIQLF